VDVLEDEAGLGGFLAGFLMGSHQGVDELKEGEAHENNSERRMEYDGELRGADHDEGDDNTRGRHEDPNDLRRLMDFKPNVFGHVVRELSRVARPNHTPGQYETPRQEHNRTVGLAKTKGHGHLTRDYIYYDGG